jgi:hypothetical protein
VNTCSGRDLRERKRATGLDGSLITSSDFGTNFQLTGSKNIGTLSVTILDQSDSSSAVWIVLDCYDLSSLVTTKTLEIDETILALMPSTTVATGDATVVVATSRSLLRTGETFLRRRLGDLGEVRMQLVPVRGSDWSVGFQAHASDWFRVSKKN